MRRPYPHDWHRLAERGLLGNEAHARKVNRRRRIRSALVALGVAALWLLVSSLVSCLGGRTGD